MRHERPTESKSSGFDVAASSVTPVRASTPSNSFNNVDRTRSYTSCAAQEACRELHHNFAARTDAVPDVVDTMSRFDAMASSSSKNNKHGALARACAVETNSMSQRHHCAHDALNRPQTHQIHGALQPRYRPGTWT